MTDFPESKYFKTVSCSKETITLLHNIAYLKGSDKCHWKAASEQDKTLVKDPSVTRQHG